MKFQLISKNKSTFIYIEEFHSFKLSKQKTIFNRKNLKVDFSKNNYQIKFNARLKLRSLPILSILFSFI